MDKPRARGVFKSSKNGLSAAKFKIQGKMHSGTRASSCTPVTPLRIKYVEFRGIPPADFSVPRITCEYVASCRKQQIGNTIPGGANGHNHSLFNVARLDLTYNDVLPLYQTHARGPRPRAWACRGIIVDNLLITMEVRMHGRIMVATSGEFVDKGTNREVKFYRAFVRPENEQTVLELPSTEDLSPLEGSDCVIILGITPSRQSRDFRVRIMGASRI